MRPTRRSSPILVAPLLAGLLTACSGAEAPPSEAPASSPDASAAAAPSSGTELVTDIDVGGRSLHLVCFGPAGAGPTVVMEAGLEGEYTAWGEQLLLASGEHRLCAYDRAGNGQSDPPTDASRTTADLVTDLRALLDGAGIEPPYVIAGHSFGVNPAVLFAATYPDEVVGAFFVDPRGPRVSGQWRDALPAAAAGEPDSVAANRDELGAYETDPSMNREHLDLTASADEVIAALDADGPLFGDRPVVVLGAAGTPDSWSDLPADLKATFDSIWVAGQQELADESTDGAFESVPNAGHFLQQEQPAVVNDALAALLAKVGGE
jgi:pimeloyl-ACP methyl ester carboxylesterase